MGLYAGTTTHMSELMVYQGARREAPGVGKFMMKHRNPLLRDFHTVARLSVRSQPPTVTLHVCMHLLPQPAH